jgi:hypothetical protein
MCGVAALSTTAGLRADDARLALTVESVAREVAARGGRLVLLAADSAQALEGLGLPGQLVADVVVREDQHVLERRPVATDPLPVRVWLAPAPTPTPAG